MPDSPATVILKSGRDKSVRQRHPRLFSGSIKQIQGNPADGDIVEVHATSGEWLARGVINHQAQTAVRLLTWEATEEIGDRFWQQRVETAVQRRQQDPLLVATNARRLLFSESDGLPGVIADDYGGHIVLQLSTLAAVNAIPPVVAALQTRLQPQSILLRSDDERLRYESKNLPTLQTGLKEPAAETVEILEGSLRFRVNLKRGQKTGFYLDQRENRARVARYCQGATVLNAFSYTGAFGVYGAAAGAMWVVNVDSSAEALKLAQETFCLNPTTADCPVDYVCADAFEDVRSRRTAGQQFDVVILDPPKFAHSPAQVEKAARAYKDLNRVGLSLVKPGGILATFSCSGVIDALLFQKILFSAALEAGREAQIVERLTQASDHPVLLSFPESEYLKGLILRVE